MQLLHVDNYTPFEWFAVEKMGPRKRMYDVVIVKAAYGLLLSGGRYELAPFAPDVTPTIHMSDEPYDFDGGAYAALRFTGDAILYKPGTDFFITGSSTPPDAQTRILAAEITIKAQDKEYSQRMHLHGKRHWQWSLIKGWHLSQSQPIEKIALRYDLAYGGSYQKEDYWERFAANPVGRGYFPVHRMDREVYYPAAEIELAHNPLVAVDKPIQVPGLGPIPRAWEARKKYAGTYDAEWKAELRRNQTADYPADFNPLFFQAAHPSWVCSPYLQHGASIQALGLTGDKAVSVKLPDFAITLNGASSNAEMPPQNMNLDTVELDTEKMRVNLVWRLTLDQAMEVSSARIDLHKHAAQ